MNINSFSRMVMAGFFVTMMLVSQTGASELFVAKTGRGTNCTQAKPCSLPMALAQATDGDTVYVAGGTYTGTGSAVIAVSKSITLRGGWNGGLRRPPVCNPEHHVTTLDGEDARQVVSISSGISATIEGFVITRGNSQLIGGGGIGTESSSTIIRNNLIIANTTTEDGGAIFINRGSAQILNNKILNNSANWAGGLRIVNDADVTIIGNEIVGNSAYYMGGGIQLGCCGKTNPLIARNVIADNNGGGYGGGIQVDTTNAQFINNILIRNQAVQGAGIWLDGMDSHPVNFTMINNTLVNEKEGGEGIGIGEYVTSSIVNNIIATHNVGITDPIPPTSTVSLNTNLFWDNNEDGFTGTNPIDGNPQFVDPSAGNYHISIGSAAIDSGVETSVTSDIDEDPRNDSSPDIGADEFFPVNPKEGTVGTEITLRNLKFGTEKGTVVIGSAALKTLEWKDGLIRGRLANALSPGTYDITIKPKPYKTATPITLASAFTIKEPEIASVAPGNAPPKTEVTITGNFFGPKVLPPPSRTTLPTVYLEYDKDGITKKKYCTVITWTMNPATGESMVTFRVPEGLPTGPHPLKITNKVGTAEKTFTID